MSSLPSGDGDDTGYPAIYYQTIRDLGIDPVVCGDIRVGIGPEGCIGSGSSGGGGGSRPVQLAGKALAKASGAPAGVARKRAPRKATGPGAGTGKSPKAALGEASGTPKEAKMANARVPAQAEPKTARGTARVASSG